MNRTIRAGVIFFYLLGSVALFWAIAFHLHPGGSFAAILDLDHGLTALVVGLVLLNLGLRFSRWQFLLRKADIRIPTRSSLSIYLGALALIITPLYVGELFKPMMLKDRHGVQFRRTLTIVILERYFDLLALVTLTLLDPRGLAAAGYWAWLAVGIGLPVAAAAVVPRLRFGIFRLFSRVRLLLFFRSSLKPSADVFAALNAPRVFLQAYAASLAAWAAAGLGLYLVLAGLDIRALGPTEGVAAFATATNAGAATLFPGGIGAMEATLNARLEAVTSAETAWSAVLLVRLLTLWFAVALGAVVLLVGFRRFLGLSVGSGEEHFTELAPVYDAQIPEHMRRHFLNKKIAPMQRVLAAAGLGGERGSGRGLDVGCGTGWYARALEDHGHVVSGFDRAPGQVRQLQQRAVTGSGAIGDACALPCAAQSFDFAYSVNVIHHLPGRAAQAEALGEIHRSLRPGGLFFLHEINVVNPLHRFYMVFLFPVLKDIDEGTEHWILPGETALFAGFERVSVTYFTFLPDFLPAWALRLLRPIERLLELSPLRKLSAHYMLVLRKLPD